jgi:hypothetical protein
MFSVFIFPIAIAAGFAIVNSMSTRSTTLKALGVATILLGVFQAMAFIGLVGMFMNTIAIAYVVLVLGACLYRSHEWWHQSEDI